MDIRKIKKLIDLLDETGVTEIEITEGEESVRISRAHQNTLINHNVRGVPEPTMYVNPQTEAPLTGKPHEFHEPLQAKPAAPQIPGYVIHSPMVGTAYLAATPEGKSFVEIGQKVALGDTLCLIEAMKMYNPIEADRAGTVTTRLIENGQPVEFEQPLFIIEEN